MTFDTIPAHYLEWLIASRLLFLDGLLQRKPMRYFSAHLPVMATWPAAGKGNSEDFPVNMTVKGIGLIPRADLLAGYTDLFEGVYTEARSASWDESLHKRVDVLKSLYENSDNFDASLLGGLEIFEGRASGNMKENPAASLLYLGMAHTGGGVQYTSFQVNGKVELLEKGGPYYRFLLAARKLFEFDMFHLFQPDYPFGYLIKVMEVRDKSPWSRMSKGWDKH